MQFFYEEQLHRMECMAQEPVLFEDIVCQMADMICPHVRVFMLFYHSSPSGQDGELTDYSECQLACLELLFPSLVIMQKMNGPFYVSYFFWPAAFVNMDCHAEGGSAYITWPEAMQAFWQLLQHPLQFKQICSFWDPRPFSYTTGGHLWQYWCLGGCLQSSVLICAKCVSGLWLFYTQHPGVHEKVLVLSSLRNSVSMHIRMLRSSVCQRGMQILGG